MIDYNVEIDVIALWMKEYAEGAGTKGFVVGLSGGIDSSAIACLAVKAVGKENVIGVMMPCDSTPDSVSDAKALANNLGIKNVMMGLHPTLEQLTLDLTTKVGTDHPEEYPDINLSATASGNIKARLRMTTLYAIAEAYGYLVLGTGNKSELMIGYGTKYGDFGIDIEPIGDYYKTEVYQMAELMHEIPDAIKTKAPSADLEEGQTDEEDIGMPYSKLDVILVKLLPYLGDWHPMYLSSYDITEEEYIKIKNMVLKSVHKNKMPPKYVRP